MKSKTDILSLTKERRTIRRYHDRPVPKNIINKIIEAGRWAPSAHNSQPWEIFVARGIKIKSKIIETLENPPPALLTSFRILLKNTSSIIKSAPIIMLVFSNGNLSRKVKSFGEPYFSITHKSEIEGVSSAIENMLLTATSLRLGTAWLTMPLFVEKRIQKVIKSNYELVAILTLGYAAEKSKKSSRKPIRYFAKYV